jgi:hypothetical protein
VRTRAGLLAIALVCSVVGCGSGSDPPRGTRVGPTIPGVTFPVLPFVDTGVFELGPRTRFPSLAEHGTTARDGMRYEVESCELRAPEHWVVRGRVTLPAGVHQATAVLTVSMAQGDMASGVLARRLTINGSGRFAVAYVVPRRGVDSIDDRFGDCAVEIAKPSVPVAPRELERLHSADAGAIHEPYLYTAPRGTLQALGIGAPLGHREDPRTQSLYTTWAGQSAALDHAYVPAMAGERPALSGLHAAKDSPCTGIDVSLRDVAVSTSRDCDEPTSDSPKLTDLPVAGAHGFVWASSPLSQRRMAVRRIGRETIVVRESNGEPSEGRIAQVASSLVTRRNMAIAKAGPARPATLDAAVDQIVRKHSGVTERARFRYRDGWMIVFEGPLATDNQAKVSYTLSRAAKLASGWWVERGGGGSGTDAPCFTGKIGVGGLDDRYSFAITGDPKWGIEGEVNGTWVPVPAVNGVAFVDRTVAHPKEIPVNLRPVDQTGRVPVCWSSAP